MMGDIVDVSTGIPVLKAHIVGTGPIDNVEIHNGMKILKRLRPYDEGDLGKRVKIVWSGARVRGRDRQVQWDGDLEVDGNSILEAVPVNFWNANHPLEHIDRHHLAWKSVTTGGSSGVILTFEWMDVGILRVNTIQGDAKIDVPSIGLEPQAWDYGDLGKGIRISRLPDQKATNELSFELPLTGLRKGDNPIYIRVVQEDEHTAWTSPIYLVF